MSGRSNSRAVHLRLAANTVECRRCHAPIGHDCRTREYDPLVGNFAAYPTRSVSKMPER